MTESSPPIAARRTIPLWAKIFFTAYMCVLVPYYTMAYGPTNFFYFCDLAMFFALAALWLESPLLASMPSVGILMIQTLWCLDFLGSLIGFPLVGMTGYMFDEKIPFFVRGLSFFHFWLPWWLMWMVYRLGYDRRAFLYWNVLSVGVVLICYLLLPAPPAPADNPNLPVNVNYVYGFNDKERQTFLPQPVYVILMMPILAIGFYAPAHLLLSKLFAPKEPQPAAT